MKILIFSYFDTNSSHFGKTYGEIASITMPSFQEYCKIHNYDFYVKTEGFDKSKSMGWPKFVIFLEKMKDYDWIFYVECDSLLMNQTIRLENLIDNNYDIIATETKRQDKIQINTGPLLVKSSEWSKQFFAYLLTKEYYWNANMMEQAAFNEEVNNNEEVRKHISIRDLRFFNSFMHEWHQEGNFRPGDFIIHGAGSSNNYRFKLFSFLKNHIIKVPEYKIPYKPFLNIGDELL